MIPRETGRGRLTRGDHLQQDPRAAGETRTLRVTSALRPPRSKPLENLRIACSASSPALRNPPSACRLGGRLPSRQTGIAAPPLAAHGRPTRCPVRTGPHPPARASLPPAPALSLSSPALLRPPWLPGGPRELDLPSSHAVHGGPFSHQIVALGRDLPWPPRARFSSRPALSSSWFLPLSCSSSRGRVYLSSPLGMLTAGEHLGLGVLSGRGDTPRVVTRGRRCDGGGGGHSTSGSRGS